MLPFISFSPVQCEASAYRNKMLHLRLRFTHCISRTKLFPRSETPCDPACRLATAKVIPFTVYRDGNISDGSLPRIAASDSLSGVSRPFQQPRPSRCRYLRLCPFRLTTTSFTILRAQQTIFKFHPARRDSRGSSFPYPACQKLDRPLLHIHTDIARPVNSADTKCSAKGCSGFLLITPITRRQTGSSDMKLARNANRAKRSRLMNHVQLIGKRQSLHSVRISSPLEH